jgi:hypothetical protein
MKLKVSFIENIEIETDDPALVILDTLIKNDCFDESVAKGATAAIEKITGASFENNGDKRTIIRVEDEDGYTLLEGW